MHKSHVYLMGYRGSGKSTVGRLLAAKLKWSAVDSDDVIEHNCGKSIREIFAAEGESGFRDLEQSALQQITSIDRPSIVSLGGGAILREANRLLICTSGNVIWLRATPETLYARIAGDGTTAQRRPNLSRAGGLAEVVDILARREPIYQQMADFIVDTDAMDADTICDRVLCWLETQRTA